jgi:integrase
MVASTKQATVLRWLQPAARPAAGGRTIHRAAAGLDLHVPAEGPGSWHWRGRPRGLRADGTRWPLRRIKIGDTLSHSLSEAMAEASQLKLRIARGDDPAAERQAAVKDRRDAAVARATLSTASVSLDAYGKVLATRGLSDRHQQTEVSQVRLALASVGMTDRAVGDIDVATVERIMALCPDKSRRTRHGALDRFLRWALPRDGIRIAPTQMQDRHARPKLLPPRERVLGMAEVAAIWRAMEQTATPAVRDLLLFLVTTPARKGEVTPLRWQDLDLESGCWSQPTSKNGQPHRFALNEHALAILTRRREAMGSEVTGAELVFPGPVLWKPFVGWSKAKNAVQRQAGVPEWRLHDLRRTFATVMVESGFDESLVDLCLNHSAAKTRSRLTRTYIQAERWPERVRMARAWSRKLAEALGEAPADGADIVPLRQTAA